MITWLSWLWALESVTEGKTESGGCNTTYEILPERKIHEGHNIKLFNIVQNKIQESVKKIRVAATKSSRIRCRHKVRFDMIHKPLELLFSSSDNNKLINFFFSSLRHRVILSVELCYSLLLLILNEFSRTINPLKPAKKGNSPAVPVCCSSPEMTWYTIQEVLQSVLCLTFF